MNKFFYPRLAVNNIKKNSKTYIPYMLTCIGTVMMFYNMRFLTISKTIGIVHDSSSLKEVMAFGSFVIAIFSLIFLFYTNSFLIKKRKKEFGLFNILGMEKKHISRIMFYEVLIISVITIAAGILSGILFSKLIILILFKLIQFDAVFGFEISITAISDTLGIFGTINAINLLFNITQVHLSNPVQLLKGGNVGEKEPKTKWLLTIIGALCLGAGYYIAVVTESPLSAVNMFFTAVLLVIAGTYCLFTAGSIAALKRLRMNKEYYYKANHFISVSGMIYRMKQNAAGLANICILSTMVIVIISSTVSLYMGMEDILSSRYPQNVIVKSLDGSYEEVKKIDSVIEQQVRELGVTEKNTVHYRSIGFVAMQDGSAFNMPDGYVNSTENVSELEFMALDEYNRLENTNVKLDSNEVLVYVFSGHLQGNELNINGYSLDVKEYLNSLKFYGDTSRTRITNSYLLVVNDEDTIKDIGSYIDNNSDDIRDLSYYYGFDIEEEREVQLKLINNINAALDAANLIAYVEGAELSRTDFYTMYGGLFFLGIFLGILFIMATVLIIYYKQVAEGYDDKERFNIMQKVGMSRSEIKKAIKSQVLTVFFLPLIAAIIHIAFAFKVITKLLLVFGMTNVILFAACTAATIAVFALFYLIVYFLTARTYYQIVS